MKVNAEGSVECHVRMCASVCELASGARAVRGRGHRLDLPSLARPQHALTLGRPSKEAPHVETHLSDVETALQCSEGKLGPVSELEASQRAAQDGGCGGSR